MDDRPIAPIERLFCEELFRIHRRQMRLYGRIGGAYVFHKPSGALSFMGGETFPTQVLGLETPDGEWMWAWADDDQLDPALTVAAAGVRAYGEAHGIAELTTGRLSVRHLRCAGHTMGAIASVVHAVHPYFRCEQPDGVALHVLLTSETYEDDLSRLDRDSVRRGIVDMFAAFAQADDMRTLRSALAAAGFAVEETATEVIGRRGDDAPLVFQRAWFD